MIEPTSQKWDWSVTKLANLKAKAWNSKTLHSLVRKVGPCEPTLSSFQPLT